MAIDPEARFRLVSDGSTDRPAREGTIDGVNALGSALRRAAMTPPAAAGAAGVPGAGALAVDAVSSSGAAQVRLALTNGKISTVAEHDDVLGLAVDDEVRAIAAGTFDRHPELVVRVRALRDEMERGFEARPELDSLAYDPGDPPITLIVRSSLPEDRFWPAYDAFLAFLADRQWMSDSPLGLHVTRMDADAS